MTTDSPRARALAQFMDREHSALLVQMLKSEGTMYRLSRVEMEDFISEAIQKLLHETDKGFDASKSVSGLVRYKTRRLIGDAAKKRKKKKSLKEVSLDDAGLESLVGVSGIRILSDTHEWQIHRHLTEEAIAQIVRELSPEEKVILVMRFEEAARNAEIGLALGKSADAVRKDWARLRVRLRDTVSTQLIEHGWTRLGHKPTAADLRLIDRWFSGTCTADDADILHRRLRSNESFSRFFGEELLIRMIASQVNMN